MNNINHFIKKEFILLSILFIIFINPFFYGYRVSMLLLFFIFFRLKYFISIIDKNVIYLLLFATSYELLASLRLDYVDRSIVAILPSVFVPMLLYLTGKYITVNYRNYQVWIFLLFILSFAFSLVPIVSILLQIKENGFIEGNRSLYLFWDENFEISATGLGSYFVLNMAAIGLINIKKNNRLESSITLLIVILFILSLICVLRLGSRTQLVIAIVSLFGTYILNIKKQSLMRNIFYAFLLLLATYYLLINVNQENDLMKFYLDRMGNEEAGFDSAGGRTERWVAALESLMTNPFGWELSRFGYAHNLWLDVARVSGLIPLLFLILFTFSSFKIWFKSLKTLNDNLYLKNYVLMFFLSFILIFTVEPVIEGMYLLFLFYCFFIGFLSGINNKFFNI